MKNIAMPDVLIFLFVVLFVYAASSKLLEYELFTAQIGRSPLIMDHSDWIAWFVPASEIIISFLLLAPRTQLIGLFAFYTMMLIFTLYILFILNLSPYVPCSCGGILSSMGWKEHLSFNICFTLLPIFNIFLYNKRTKVPKRQID